MVSIHRLQQLARRLTPSARQRLKTPSRPPLQSATASAGRVPFFSPDHRLLSASQAQLGIRSIHTGPAKDLRPETTTIEHNNLFTRTLFTDPDYHYHITRFENLGGIRVLGLEPGFGGIHPGCSRLSNEFEFMQSSQGYVHASPHSSVMNFYIQYLNMAQGENGPSSLGDAPIALRIKQDATFWEEDPYDSDGKTTPFTISPDHIDVYTSKGWVPLSALSDTEAKVKIFPKQMYTLH